MKNIISFFVGTLFAIGLGFGGMLDPHNIESFLDITGAWAPGLMFVMGGALLVYGMVFHLWVKKKPKPLFDLQFQLPQQSKVNARLAIGGILFGMGWGLLGYCPGPAVVSSVRGQPGVIIFVVSMIVGMRLVAVVDSVIHKISSRNASSNRKPA